MSSRLTAEEREQLVSEWRHERDEDQRRIAELQAEASTLRAEVERLGGDVKQLLREAGEQARICESHTARAGTERLRAKAWARVWKAAAKQLYRLCGGYSWKRGGRLLDQLTAPRGGGGR